MLSPWRQDRRCNYKPGIPPVCFVGSQERALYMTKCKRFFKEIFKGR